MTIYLYGRFFSLSVKNLYSFEQNYNITISYLNYNNAIILKSISNILLVHKLILTGTYC